MPRPPVRPSCSLRHRSSLPTGFPTSGFPTSGFPTYSGPVSTAYPVTPVNPAQSLLSTPVTPVNPAIAYRPVPTLPPYAFAPYAYDGQTPLTPTLQMTLQPCFFPPGAGTELDETGRAMPWPFPGSDQPSINYPGWSNGQE